MDQAEASGKTVDDALRAALAKLNASRDEVEFVVLDEGRKGGLFGRGARDAVVRVERLAQPATREQRTDAPDTRIPRRTDQPAARGQRGGGRGQGGRPGQAGQSQSPQSPQSGQARGDRRGRPAGGRGGRALENLSPRLTEEDFLRPVRYQDETADDTPEQSAETSPAAGRGGPQPPRDRRRSERDRRRDEGPPVEPDINAEEVEFAAQVVDDLLRLLDIDAGLTIREPLTPGDGRGVVRAVIDINGDDLGLLIGRRGDTLLSLQYLVNLVVTRRFPGQGGVTIDVEHYRHRREEQVVSLAQRMADRVRQTGSAITLEPMTAAERRLVHLTLADDPELETNSVGEGENRKVVISARR